ncbi:MAG TPA: hypothetical protein PKG50_04950 [Candidatus Bipolaricaulis anaerobius]|nr:hypothetical protein [Candidatus Bipolaricaulis anaerobius]HNS24109.1 hypothetical protein [Candidatus Bipolaricaulis anaerobius]
MELKTRGHPAEELPAAVNNRSLFPDYYLAELARDDPFFQESKRVAEPVWRAIKDLYERVKGELPTANEARTEQLFIYPVLDLLGHRDSYAVQRSFDFPGSTGRTSRRGGGFAGRTARGGARPDEMMGTTRNGGSSSARSPGCASAASSCVARA